MIEPRIYRTSFAQYYKASGQAGMAGLITYLFFPLRYAYAVTAIAAVIGFLLVHMRDIRLDEEGIVFRRSPSFDEVRIAWTDILNSVVGADSRGEFRELAIFTGDRAFPPNAVWRLDLRHITEEDCRNLFAVSELRVAEVVDPATYLTRVRENKPPSVY